MGVQLSEECAELGEREETYILNTNLTSGGKKLLILLIKKTRLIKIFEIYRDKSVVPSRNSYLMETSILLLQYSRNTVKDGTHCEENAMCSQANFVAVVASDAARGPLL